MQALRKVERPRRHPGWTESMAGPALLAVLCLLMVLEVAASTRPLTPHRFPYPMLDHDGTASYRLTSSPLELSSSTETLVTQSMTPPADRATGPLTSVRSSTNAGVAETSGPDADRQTTSLLQTYRQTTSPLETDRHTTSLLQTERQTITSPLETDRQTTSLLQTDRQTTSPLGMDRQTTRNPDEDVQTDPRDLTEKQTTYVPNEMERTVSWNGQLSSKQSTRLVADDKATKERTVDVPTVGDDEDTRIPTDGVTDPESTKPDKGSPAATTSSSLEVTVNASKPAATTFSKFVEEAEVSSLSESAEETKVTSSSTHIKKAEISAPAGPVEEETVTTTTATNPYSKHDAGTSKSIEFTADSKPVEERLTTPRHPIGARLDIIVDEVADADSQGDPESTTIRTPTERPSSPRPLSGRPRPPANLAREPQPASENKLDARLNEVLDEEAYDRKEHLGGPWLIGTRTNDATSSSPSVFGGPAQGPAAGRSVVLYRNYDVDSQERERELEERAREQNHPADLEDSNVHEVNHYVPDDDQDEAETSEPQQQQRSVARWYLLLLAGNSTTVRLRQKDFAKYLKLNLAARLSVEYNDLRVNRVEFKPLLMVNVTIFSRPKDNEEAPLHMLADTNATLLELSGEEYHVVRFITIPSDHQDAARALPSGGFQADSYSSGGPLGVQTSWQSWHVDMGVAVYFALAAALVSVLLAVFLVGLWRYLRTMAAEVSWRPWRHYKPIVLPRWSLPLQHRLCADHIVHCAPLRNAPSVWTTAGADGEVPVQKLPRLVLEPGPQAAAPVLPAILGGEPAPSTADTLLQVQAPAPARPNSRLSLFGEQRLVVQPKRASLGGAGPLQRLQRLQPQGRHPLDVRIHRAGRPSGATAPPRPPGPTVLGLDNPNYMLQ